MKKIKILMAALIATMAVFAAHTFTPATVGTKSAGSYTCTVDGVTLNVSNGLCNEDEIRVYAGATLTLSAKSNIVKIEITTTNSNNPASNLNSTNGYTTNGAQGTWTGSAKEVKFTASKQAQILNIAVTLEADEDGSQNIDEPETVGTFYVYKKNNAKVGYQIAKVDSIVLTDDSRYAVSVETPENGTLSADKAFATEGETVTLKATAHETYKLVEITAKDAQDAKVTVADNKFTMPANDVTVGATFKKVIYTITANSSNVTAPSSAQIGDEIALNFTPEDDYMLDVVTVTDANGNDVTVSADYKFIMPESDVTITATFKQIEHQVTISETKNGTVTCINPNAKASELVYLQISAEDGYKLDKLTITDGAGKELDVNLNGSYANQQFTMPSVNVKVNATFVQIDYTITVKADFITAPATAHYGDTVTLTVTPTSDYELQDIYVNNGSIHVSADYKFTMPSKDVVITANFLDKTQKEYAISVDQNTKNGKIALSSGISACKFNTLVRVTVTPDTGYELDQLKVTDANNQEVTLNSKNSFYMPASEVTVTATFKLKDYSISYEANVSGPKTAQMGENVELTFTPDTGYDIDEVTVIDDNNDKVTVNADKSFTMPASNVTVSVTQKKHDYKIVIESMEHGTLTLEDGSTTMNYGVKVDFTILPDVGYELEEAVATDAQGNKYATGKGNYFYFNMPASDIKITATFKKTDYVITNYNNSLISIAAKANYNDLIKPTFKLKTGYDIETFTVTEKDGSNVDLNADSSFYMPASNVTVNATEKKHDYAIKIVAGEHGKVTCENAISQYDKQVIVAITPDTGYEIDTKSVTQANGDEVSFKDYDGNGSYYFFMPASDATVNVTFKKIDYSISYSSSLVKGVTTAQYGDEVSLNFTFDTGYELDQLTVKDADGNLIDVSSDYKFTMPASNVTVKATQKKHNYDIKIDKNIKNGTLTVESDATTATYRQNVIVDYTANTGYGLEKYVVTNAEGKVVAERTYTYLEISGSFTFYMPASDVTITATFKKIDYSISYSSSLVTGVATAQYGDEVSLNFTFDTGCELDQLTVKDAKGTLIEVSGNKFTMPASNVTVEATQKQHNYAINIDENIENGTLTVRDGATTATYRQSVKVYYTPNTGYELENIIVTDAQGNVVKEGSISSFGMPLSDVTITATFKKITSKILSYFAPTVTKGSAMGKLTGPSTAEYGEEVTVEVDVPINYVLDSLWVLISQGNGDYDTIVYTTNKFTMPAKNIRVGGKLKRIYSGTCNGYQWVDLGNGTLWATCNVGASKPEDYGNYYAWGETTPKDDYDFDTYKYFKKVDNTYWVTKYYWNANSSGTEYGYEGLNDSILYLEAEDDAATQVMGENWCTPTKSQLEALLMINTSSTVSECSYVERNGVGGMLIKSKMNDNELFVPAAGRMYEKDQQLDNGQNFYWTNQIVKSRQESYCYGFISNFASHWGTSTAYRYLGFPIRAVIKQ